MPNEIFDVLIIGGGPAGITAAIYTSRAKLNTLVIAGAVPGGQLVTTTGVENYPGFPEGILGPDLIFKFRSQAERFGTIFKDTDVVEISGSLEEGFKVKTDSGEEFVGKVVIVATGASARWLGLESEQKLRGKGVSACAICDGFFFKDKVVAVVGGGDAAMEESLFLTRFANKVYVLVRSTKEDMKASKYMQDRAFSNDKIEFMFNVEVREVLGQDFVEGVRVVNIVSNQESTLDDVNGLFLAIGRKPDTEFLQEFIKLGKSGFIDVVDSAITSKEGVFAAGDVADYKYRQAVTAAGFGCIAALDAEKLLSKLNLKKE